eukprot:6174050-Pleurochrysis_carterae.AAC.1
MNVHHSNNASKTKSLQAHEKERIQVAKICLQLTIMQRCILGALLACETAACGARAPLVLTSQHVVHFLLDSLQDTGTSICSNLCYRLSYAYMSLCTNRSLPTTGLSDDDLRLMRNVQNNYGLAMRIALDGRHKYFKRQPIAFVVDNLCCDDDTTYGRDSHSTFTQEQIHHAFGQVKSITEELVDAILSI